MDTNGFERHSFPARLECRYLLHAPAEVAAETVLAVALHGYGSNPETMLRLTVPLLGPNHIVAAIQAPNQHYAGGPSAEAAAAYNWGIRDHWESTVRLHHDMVRATLAELRERFQLLVFEPTPPVERLDIGTRHRGTGRSARHAGRYLGHDLPNRAPRARMSGLQFEANRPRRL